MAKENIFPSFRSVVVMNKKYFYKVQVYNNV